ncbi:MAG: hypothetical protein FWH38_04595, partial [Treponema sp.]|nr:hypothetical protein [Treponema sp.]
MKNQYRILGAITLILAIAFMAGCPQEASSSKDNYGIELKQGASALTSYTFTNRAPLTVTVANIGTAATGPLTIVIDGTGSAAFAVSPESLGSIAKDGSDTFTVAPTGTLTPGPYSATVTVSGAKGITASFDVDYEEPEEPAYGIALMAAGEALESYTFTGLDSLDVTVVNSGTAATGALTIEISGDDLDAFVLSETEITDIAVSASAAFTVEPASELDAGSYSATITVSGDNGIEASFTVFYENILVVADVLDGLWWNEDLIQGTFSGLIPEGTPGVYVFDNLNYWSLNSWGFAYKGTFTVSGENSGNFTLNQTEKKDESTDWGFAEASDTQTGTWTLSNSG